MFGSFLAKKLFSSDNSTSRKLKSRHKALARQMSRKAMFESLEERSLLTTLANLGFESGLASWSVAGGSNATTVSTLGGVVNPVSGSKFAVLTTTGTFSVSGGTPGNASQIEQSFSASAGDTVTIAWNYLTDEVEGSQYDFARGQILNSSGSSVIQSLFFESGPSSNTVSASGSGYSNQTGWHTITSAPLAAGNYILRYSVTDTVDGIVDTAIAVDAAVTGSLSASLSSGNLAVSDTSGVANHITVSVSGTDLVLTDANEQFQSAPTGGTLSNGNKTLTIPLASVNTLAVNTDGGNDELIVNGSIGKPISYDGGAGGSDSLRLTGTAMSATYTPDATTNGKGVFSIAGGSTVSFSNLEPVDYDVVGGTFTLLLPGANDIVDVSNGTLIDGVTSALKISGSSGGVPFENARVRGADIVIDTTTVAGTDTITVTSANNNHTDTSLNINTGAEAGDIITVNGITTFNGTTTLNAKTVNLNANVTNAVTGNTATVVNVIAPAQIQDGINVAASGATVNLSAGTYTLDANVTLSKDLTLKGPNVGISPLTGGPARNPEAIINGGDPGPLNGSGGFLFNLATGITSLTADGLTFTNFDGNLFASSLVPITNVGLHQNIFTANNGGLFYKFDTSVATDFDVVDNKITNHSMSGVNTALFFLGNVANSHFDGNEVTNISSRELINVYFSFTNSTISNNILTTTAGLALLAADQNNVTFDNNKITSTTTPLGVGAIYVSTNDGHNVTNLKITNNNITTVTGAGGIGIRISTDTASAASITTTTISGNTIAGTLAYGLDIDTFFGTGTGTIDGVTVTNNQFSNNAFGPIFAYARVTSGTNLVKNLTIDSNTFTESAGIYTASFYLDDFRNVSGTNSFSGNSYTLSGTLPGGTDSIRVIGLRGSQTGTWNINNNNMQGGGVLHNNAPTVFVSGIGILSKDATTGNIPASAVINIGNNFINGFEDGIVVRDGVTPGYGGLTAGTQVNVHGNDLSGNSLFSLRSGATGATVDASANWWGTNTAAGVPAKTTANVDYTPWLNVVTDTSVSAGFQGDFSTLNVDDNSPQVGATTRIQEGVNLIANGAAVGSARTVNVFGGSYTENVAIAKSLTLDGEDASNPTINGGASAPVSVSGANTIILKDLILSGTSSAIGNSGVTSLTLDNIASSLTSAWTGTTGTVNLKTKAGANDDTVSATGTSFGVSAQAALGTVSYAAGGVTNLNIDTRDGNDSVNVTAPASGGTIISVDGGSNGAPGDTLFYDNTGASFSVNPTNATDGNITSATRQTVNYVNIENLSVVDPIIAGTAGADTIVVSFVSASPYKIQYVLNGGIPVVLTTPSSFTFNGGGGDDLMVVDLSAGDAIPANGIFMNGETEDSPLTAGANPTHGDVLKVIGRSGETANYYGIGSAGATNKSATVVTNDGTIFGTGLEPTDMTAMALVNVYFSGADEALTVSNGVDAATGTQKTLSISGTTGGLGFETLNLWSNTTVNIDTTNTSAGGTNGNDTVTVSSVAIGAGNNDLSNGHNNTNLTIKTGAQALDVVNFNGVLTLTGNLNVDTSGGVANVNAAINAATITGNVPVVNVDDAPSGQIQDGVDLAASGGTVNVLAGTYAENVTITKALNLKGAQAGNNANARFAAFAVGVNGPKANPAVESVLTSPINKPTGPNPGADDLIRALASNILIDGMVIDGNNPAIVGASGTQINGIDIDARRAITNIDSGNGFNDTNNLEVRNDIMQNFGQRAMSLSSSGAVLSGITIHNNVIRTFLENGVLIFGNAYADIQNNTVDVPSVPDGAIGIALQNFSAGSPTMTWSGNNVTVGQDGIGIHANLFYGPAATLNISGNTVNAAAGVTGADDFTWGINVWSVQNGSTVNVTNNTVGSAGGEFARGINLWNLPTTDPVDVSGGSVNRTVVGINLDNVDLYFGGGSDTTVNVTNVPVTANGVGIRVRNSSLTPAPFGPNVPTGSVRMNLSAGSTTAGLAGATGILVEDNTADAFNAQLQLVGGTSVSGGTTGLRVDGAQASLVGSTLVNTAFSGQTGDYITLAHNSMTGQVINGTAVTFGGSLASAMTVPQNYALEDKITHAIDNATLGFVRVFNGHVFVTPNSFTNLSTPITTTPDVQRAVNVALAGDTVHVNSGTYPNPVSVNKNLTIDGEVNGSGDPNSIIMPAAGTAMTIVSPVTTMTLSDLSLVAPAGGSALLANLGSVGTTLNLTNLNSSGAAGGSVSNWNTINFTTNDNANTVFVTGVASGVGSTSPLVGKAAQKIEVQGKLIPLGWATTANGTLNVDVKNGDDTVSASPSATSFMNLVGGPHTVGDTLNLDMSGTTPVVIVDGAGGNADSASTKTLHFSQFESLFVYDPVLTNTHLGDFYLRGTDQADYIQFVSAAEVNPKFRVRVGNVYYPTNGSMYGPYVTSGPGASKLFVYGRGGNDTITMYNTRVDAAFFGEDGDDIITGGYGNDLLVGGQGADRINGGSVGGNDEVWGDDFNPALDTPSVASQTLSGGNDQINTYGGNDTVYGQAGADIINTGDGADYINGGAGADQIDGQAGDDRIYGGAGDDVISGSDGNDIIAGNDGNDSLYGRTGNDIVIGGLGVDNVNGNEGSDALVGDESNGAGSKSLAKGDAADAALLALMMNWGPTPTLASLGAFNSAGADGSTDTLWGGGAADAFFGAPPDNAADRNAFGYGPDLN